MICVTEEEMRIIIEIISKFASDCQVLAYGSRFKGTNRKASDLDLAFKVKGAGRLGLTRILELEEAFSESDLPYRVDVIDYNAAPDVFRGIIDGGNEIISEVEQTEKE